MSGINRTKIGLKIFKQLEKKGLLKDIVILRAGENVFREKQDDLYVCTVKGYYHTGSTSINIINGSTDATTINKNYQDKLLMIVDDSTRKIQGHDYFVLDNVKYEIVDKGNVEDIVYDSCLKRLE